MFSATIPLSYGLPVFRPCNYTPVITPVNTCNYSPSFPVTCNRVAGPTPPDPAGAATPRIISFSKLRASDAMPKDGTPRQRRRRGNLIFKDVTEDGDSSEGEGEAGEGEEGDDDDSGDKDAGRGRLKKSSGRFPRASRWPRSQRRSIPNSSGRTSLCAGKRTAGSSARSLR